LTLPKTLANQYKDMYVEMDVELLAPDIEHSIGVLGNVNVIPPLFFSTFK
jgi:hypothetical protein